MLLINQLFRPNFINLACFSLIELNFIAVNEIKWNHWSQIIEMAGINWAKTLYELANNIKLMFHYPKGIVSNYCYNNILKILYVFRNKIICCWIQFLPFPQALIPPVWMFWRNEKLGGNNKKWLQFTVIIKFSSSNPSAFINQSNFNKLTECLQSNLVSVCFD